MGSSKYSNCMYKIKSLILPALNYYEKNSIKQQWCKHFTETQSFR